MLKTSFVLPSSDRQKGRSAPGARGCPRLCDRGLAGWSNSGEPFAYPPSGYPGLYAKPSRIVNVCSRGQRPIDLDDVMLTRGYSGSRAYAQSKLAQIMFTF